MPDNLVLESKILLYWSGAAGLALWLPAIGLPVGPMMLQTMDILVILGAPMTLVFGRAFEVRFIAISALFLASITLSTWVGGQLFVYLYYLIFITLFTAQVFLVTVHKKAANVFLRSFALGGLLTCVLFVLQIIFGAEALDFRSNSNFQLPQQFGRGFALFPEVSTFAAHAVLTLAGSLALILHPSTSTSLRRAALAAIFLPIAALLFTRSSAFLVLGPMLIAFVIFTTTRATFRSVVAVGVVAAIAAFVMTQFLDVFYSARLETSSAERSASMRLASVLGGLTPLTSGELFGVGLGNNDLVRIRAHEIGRELGLNFGTLPTGVSSLIVGRIFEEGWVAVFHLGAALWLMVKAVKDRSADLGYSLLLLIAVASFLMSLLVIGYRGIYSSWLWIPISAALVCRSQEKSLLLLPCSSNHNKERLGENLNVEHKTHAP